MTFRRLLPLLLFLGIAGLASQTIVRAQTAPNSARYAFADTTLLRDTLDLHFDRLFPLADSLRVLPDSLRSFSIRTRLSLDSLVAVAHRLGMPVDSVGPVLEREQFNPLARQGEHSTAFNYSSTYSIARQSTSWGNSATYDLVRGPLVFRNVTTVQIDRITQAAFLSFHRSKTANSEVGWAVSPDLSFGARANLQRSENTGFGTVHGTSENQFQGSLHSKHDFGDGLKGTLDLFGGPFDEPRSSLSTASKRGLGTDWDGHAQFDGLKWLTFDGASNGTLRYGHAAVPKRSEFPTQDLTWRTNGNVSVFGNSPASVQITYDLNGNRTERPTTFTQITTPTGATTPDTSTVDQVVSEPSGSANISAGTQLRLGPYGQATVTESYTRTNQLLASDSKVGIVFASTTSRAWGLTANSQLAFAGWAMDATYSDSRPVGDDPRSTAVVDPQTQSTIPVSYREHSTTRTRDLQGTLTRHLTTNLSFKARGDVSLTSYRFSIPDASYLIQSHGQTVEPSDPHDDYRQSYRLETTYAHGNDLSTTMALQVDRILTLYLLANRSGTNQEDRPYRAEWLWSYQLMPGLTANQRNEIDATYTRNLYAPQKNRLTLSYLTITTLTAALTPHLQVDLTHNANYGPNGDFVRSADGLEYFNVSDASRDYTLSGRIAYTPIPALTFTLNPYYQAHFQDGYTAGAKRPTSQRRELTLAGGATVNVPVGAAGHLSGSLQRNLDARRDFTYTNGLLTTAPRSQTDYWSGVLQFSWRL